MAKTSEAQLRASVKWQKENQSKLTYRFDKDLVDEFKRTCIYRRDAQASVIRRAILTYLEDDDAGLILPESTLKVLRERAQSYHITTKQLLTSIVNDWLNQHR